jgi:hypothetical protein
MLNQENDELVVELVVTMEEMMVVVVVVVVVVEVEVGVEEEYEVFSLMLFELVIVEKLVHYVKQ